MVRLQPGVRAQIIGLSALEGALPGLTHHTGQWLWGWEAVLEKTSKDWATNLSFLWNLEGSDKEFPQVSTWRSGKQGR